MSENENNYLYISFNTALGKIFKNNCFNLERQYMNEIQNETYSWNKPLDDWREFSENEINLILSIK